MTAPPAASASASAAAPLLLTIRFSTSLPDLDLDVALPQATTVLALKHLLRGRLASRNRLRLIYQGRILPDDSALSAVLRPPPPAQPPADAHDASAAPASRQRPKPKAADAAAPAPARVYVNCSIGDELSPDDLAEERAGADKPPAEPLPGPSTRRPPWTRPRPRGFDRLLQAGFTPSEISTLRTQFASVHTERFAPDAMPSPDSLRSLEDAWIDSNAGELPSAANPLEEDLGSMSTVLDILVRGMMIGFFFPLGSMTWLLRQGIWSEKWQIFVGSGVVLSLTVGVVMGISGER